MPLPVVLVFSGADPSGGAGIQADIEAVASMGCHAAVVTTAVTVQNTQGVRGFQTLGADLIQDQAAAIFDDMPVRAVKTGMLASAATIKVIAELMAARPSLPLVVDPVMTAGSGDPLSDNDCLAAMRDMIAKATIVTPNLPELEQLAPNATTLQDAAKALAALGCRHLLVTGTHGADDPVINRLFDAGELVSELHWPRLEGNYHGSGCTLAAALAAQLAHGVALTEAVSAAQAYTWQSLAHANALGQGQYIPDRFFWATRRWQHE